MTKYSQKTNLLPGNEILGCPCVDCSSTHQYTASNADYPCIHSIKKSLLPNASKMRYTTASAFLAEGCTDEGKSFIAYSSKRGTICFVQEGGTWVLACAGSFWDLDAHILDVDTQYSPAMCLRSLEYELTGLHPKFSLEENIIHLLIDDIKDCYLKALKDEVAYLEEYVL